jgi:hypothetical protein
MNVKLKINLNTIAFLLFLVLTSLWFYFVLNHAKFGIDTNALIDILPKFFWIDFSLIILFLFLNIDNIKKQVKISEKTKIYLLIIISIGFLFRAFLVPHTHRVFFDEDLYLGIANSIATENRAILCNYGEPTRCFEGILNKDPSGFPFLVSIFFRIFGKGDHIAFALSTIIGTLSILIIFLTSLLIFNNEKTALYASLFFAFLPVNIVWSGSAATEIYFLFFSLLTTFSLILFSKTNDYKALALGISFLAFTVQIRPEGLLFVLIFAISFFAFVRELKKTIFDYKFFLILLLFLFLILPHTIQMYIFREGDWGAPNGKKFSLEYLGFNLKDNIGFFINNEMHPIIITILALFGSYYIFKKDLKLIVSLFSWFFLFFVLFVLFYAGSVLSGGIGSRFVNIYISPLILLAGFGASELRKRIENKKHFDFGIIFLLLLSFYLCLPYITIPDKQAQYARDMHDFVMRNMEKIDPKCYVFTHNPSIFLVAGRNSLQTWYAQFPYAVQHIFNATDCVMWLEGAWCLFEPFKSTVCKYMHDNYDLEIVARLVREENPGQVFTIYRVYRRS